MRIRDSRRSVALKKHTAVDGLQAAAAERIYILCDKFFQPEQACCDQLHEPPPSLLRTGKQGLKDLRPCKDSYN